MKSKNKDLFIISILVNLETKGNKTLKLSNSTSKETILEQADKNKKNLKKQNLKKRFEKPFCWEKFENYRSKSKSYEKTMNLMKKK